MKKISLSTSNSRITHAVRVDWTDYNTLSSTDGESQYIDIPGILNGRWIITRVLLYITEGFTDADGTADCRTHIGTPIDNDNLVGSKPVDAVGAVLDARSGTPEVPANTYGIVDTDLRVAIDPPSGFALSDLVQGEMIVMLRIVNVDSIIATT